MRIFTWLFLILAATLIFGWSGFLVGCLIAFGVSLFRNRRVEIDHSQPFFSSTKPASIEDVHFFELFGYLCKIDGVVSRDEIHGVEVVFDHLQFTSEDRADAIAAFNRGKQRDFDFRGVLEHISQLHLPPDVAAQLIHLMNVVVANADGSGLVAEERNLLFRIGDAFGLTTDQIAEILMLRHRDDRERAVGHDQASNSLELAYETLGFEEDMNETEMSRRYRKLRSRYHPDKLAKTASSAQRNAAERRFTEIQRAWDIVRVHHGL